VSAADPRPARTVSLLGSTGSIGTQAIQVIQANRERYRVVALTAGGSDLGLLAQQAVALHVDAVGVANGTTHMVRAAIAAAAAEAGDTAYTPEILVGPEASLELAARPVDVVLNGITGAIGLEPTLAALRAGSTLALANKESLIVGGTRWSRRGRARADRPRRQRTQCYRAVPARRPSRGGAPTGRHRQWRDRSAAMPRAQLHDVTPEQALAHPNWDDGPGRHHELGDPGQQGPGGHRGAPALRRALRAPSTSSCTRSSGFTRWSSSTTARRSPRWDRHGCSCRSRSACPGRIGLDDIDEPCDWTGRSAGLGVPSRSTTTPSPPSARRGGWGRPGGTGPGGLQRRQRGVCRRLP
jgi:hypothetical protein